jgi:hypothetical protein
LEFLPLVALWRVASFLFVLLVSYILLFTLSAAALAVGGDPQTLFADTITATGTSRAVSEMQKQPPINWRARAHACCSLAAIPIKAKQP